MDIAGELRAAAAASFVLARNDDLLPLSRSRLRRVAVIGPNAEVARTLGGGSATVFPPYTVSPLEGLRAAGLDVAFAPGTLGHLQDLGRPRALAAAAGRMRAPAPRSGSSRPPVSWSARSSATAPCSGG